MANTQKVYVGKPRLSFGAYEAKKTASLWTLGIAVALAVCSYALTTWVPWLEGQGETAALFAGLAVVILRAVMEWLRDNRDKKIPDK